MKKKGSKPFDLLIKLFCDGDSDKIEYLPRVDTSDLPDIEGDETLHNRKMEELQIEDVSMQWRNNWACLEMMIEKQTGLKGERLHVFDEPYNGTGDGITTLIVGNISPMPGQSWAISTQVSHYRDGVDSGAGEMSLFEDAQDIRSEIKRVTLSVIEREAAPLLARIAELVGNDMELAGQALYRLGNTTQGRSIVRMWEAHILGQSLEQQTGVPKTKSMGPGRL